VSSDGIQEVTNNSLFPCLEPESGTYWLVDREIQIVRLSVINNSSGEVVPIYEGILIVGHLAFPNFVQYSIFYFLIISCLSS